MGIKIGENGSPHNYHGVHFFIFEDDERNVQGLILQTTRAQFITIKKLIICSEFINIFSPFCMACPKAAMLPHGN